MPTILFNSHSIRPLELGGPNDDKNIIEVRNAIQKLIEKYEHKLKNVNCSEKLTAYIKQELKDLNDDLKSLNKYRFP